MSASSSSLPPPHRIAVVMSPVGRFLQCSECKLSYIFPDGAQFGTIAKQFEVHTCSAPIRIPDLLIENNVENGAPVPDGPERRFVILRYEGHVPMMASCAKCARKFFTPPALAHDAIGAVQMVLVTHAPLRLKSFNEASFQVILASSDVSGQAVRFLRQAPRRFGVHSPSTGQWSISISLRRLREYSMFPVEPCCAGLGQSS
jgi:hypothetical protein